MQVMRERSGVNAATVEMDYNRDPGPLIEGLEPGEEVVIVDFSFAPPAMAKLLGRTDRVVWIDHHATAASYDYGRTIAGVRNLEEKGPAACELTWSFFYPGKEMPLAVRLVGDRDCWRWEYGALTAQFHERMKAGPHGPREAVWASLLGPLGSSVVQRLAAEGKVALDWRDQFTGNFRQYGFESELDGQPVFVMNLYTLGSDMFGPALMEKYPVCAAFVFDGERYVVSVYTARADIDLGAICKKRGGGGHRQAAGFVCAELPFRKGGARGEVEQKATKGTKEAQK